MCIVVLQYYTLRLHEVVILACHYNASYSSEQFTALIIILLSYSMVMLYIGIMKV